MLKDELIQAAKRHCKEREISLSRLSTIVVNDGKFFDRVEKGGGFTIATYEKFMSYFEENKSEAA